MQRFNISPTVRISLGLCLFTVMLLMGIEMLNIIPEPYEAILDSRKKTCESLAVYGSMSIQKGDYIAIQNTMEAIQQRNDDILSAALVRYDGKILAMVGDHDNLLSNSGDASSGLNTVQVPINKNEKRWGTFEIKFSPINSNSLKSLWSRPIIKIIALIIPFSFIGYLLLIKKTLNHLDPSAVVPDRVKLALDSLVEGVVLMDNHERIVMANKAFENNVGNKGSSLLGKKVSDLDWSITQRQQKVIVYPWRKAIREGASQSAIPMKMSTKEGDERTFMVNGAPILDAVGKTRGALATFDDVTQLEEQNSKLQDMLDALKKSRDEIRRQNHKLQILATEDPLTGCLNRRAFYEKFEAEFNRARRYGRDFACVMIDLDHFKSVNDMHGHPAGDKVLQKVSSIIRDCLRESDYVCRYGGEEFCLFLPDTEVLGAFKTAERIRLAIYSRSILNIHVTASLGVSTMGNDPRNPSELLSQADKALYKSKSSGRNRVTSYVESMNELPHKKGNENARTFQQKQEADPHIPHYVVKALMLALEHRDIPTAEHSRKVADLCVSATRDFMSISECSVLEVAGMLHDIGKLGVPDSILLKPGPLTKEEWEIMHDHERRSVDVIASTFLSPELVKIVKYHSYWFDGSTSDDPSHPKMKNIPLGSRILHIADAFHAMISHRPYRQALSYEDAYKELRRCAGTQFDPELVEHFISVVKARDDTRREDSLGLSNSIKLKIGKEIETLLVAVNTGSWGDLSISAENLTALSEKYRLDQVAEISKEIEKAATGDLDQIEIINLTSELLGVCGPINGSKSGVQADLDASIAA